MKSVISFLRSLRRHNDRVWFNEHKDKYLAVKEQIEALTSRLIAGMAAWEPLAARLAPSDCTYRIYRDTRFSADKTPYKTHIGIVLIAPGGKKSLHAGYYLHLEPDNCFVAAGKWCPDSTELKRIRTDIYENVDEYLEILDQPAFKKYYPTVGDNLLKTPPKGFPKDWEHIDLLKPRDFLCYTPLDKEDIYASDFEDRVLERMRAARPYCDFLNFALYGADEE